MVLFVFQFYPVCNFGKFISYGFGTVQSEKVKRLLSYVLLTVVYSFANLHVGKYVLSPGQSKKTNLHPNVSGFLNGLCMYD